MGQPLLHQRTEQFMTSADELETNAAPVVIYAPQIDRRKIILPCKIFFSGKSSDSLSQTEGTPVLMAYAKSAAWSCHFLMRVVAFCTLDVHP